MFRAISFNEKMSRAPGLPSGHPKGLIVSMSYPYAVCPVLKALDKDEQNRHNPGLQEMYPLVGPETVNKLKTKQQQKSILKKGQRIRIDVFPKQTCK